MNESNQSPQLKSKENLWINFGFNLIIPVLLLRKGDDWFGETIGKITESSPDSTEVSSILLVMAVFFPVAYGTYDFVQRRRWNFLSILGAISALLTGGIGLMPGGSVNMFALKEATLPALLALLVIVTLNTKKPLVKMFLYNPDIFQVDKIDSHLIENGTSLQFHRLLTKCTWLLAATFLFSAILNFILARIIVVTEPFTNKNAFNDEVGVMMAWSFPVISLPCMVVSGYTIWLLIRGIKDCTGLEMEEAIRQKSN
jgi:hypothetical protein|tara:strand:- start:5891 stop:6658 length:768 start_codon:yes stop_codon:yes gene_type:complete